MGNKLTRWILNSVLCLVLLSCLSPPAQALDTKFPQTLPSTVAAAGATASERVIGYPTVSLQLTGTWSGTIQFETSNDNSTWVTVSCTPTNSTTTVTSTTANGLWNCPVATWFRLNATAWTSGTANVVLTLLAAKIGGAGAAAGTVTTSGSPASGQVSFFTGAATISGDSNLTWDNSAKTLTFGTGNTVTITTAALTGNRTATFPDHNWSPAISSLDAATAANTIASGNNTGQVWNWANTTNTTVAFTFGETTAATNGTASSGIPNQVLLKLTTLAASTQSPFQVYVRGTHLVSADFTNPQLLANDGTAANPTYAFASSPSSGMNLHSGAVVLVAGGTEAVQAFSNTVAIVPGTATNPGLQDTFNGNSGLSWLVAHTLSVTDKTDGEWCRWLSIAYQCTRGSADATAFAVNFRKARGTSGSPTVITTGDALYTESGYGYVGATNTFREVTRIESDSTGTISDATNGIGGVLKLLTAKQGVDTAPIERVRLDAFGHLNSVAGTANTPSINTCTNGTLTGGTDNAFLISFTGANSTCSVNFGTTWLTNAPVCVMSEKTVTATTVGDITATTSLVTITPSAAYANTDTVNVICLGRL